MIHTRLKPATQINTSFSLTEATKDIVIPDESKNIAQKYVETGKLAEEDGLDIMIFFENSIIYGYDYMYNGKKLILPELNPITIFYSNALMSYGRLNYYKEVLLSKSAEAGIAGEFVDFNHFGTFFQLAVNCIINLQATIESFVNYKIIGKYDFIDKNGKTRNPSIHEKMDIAILDVTKKNFQNDFSEEYKRIKDLVGLRNHIIHLTPNQDITNTKYKILFRQIIDFAYDQTIATVKDYVNFYEPNIIEECPCGKEFFFDYCEKPK